MRITVKRSLVLHMSELATRVVLWLVHSCCFVLFFCRSKDFRPSFSRIHELRGLVRSGTPMLAVTATVTDKMCIDIISTLDMKGCKTISVSLNRPNICYFVKDRTTIDSDLSL